MSAWANGFHLGPCVLESPLGARAEWVTCTVHAVRGRAAIHGTIASIPNT